MPFDHLTLERDGPLAILTIDRPEALNALNTETMGELHDVLDEIEGDEDLRVLILTGAGDRAFVAGADIQTMERFGPLEAEDHAANGLAIMERLERSHLVVIAAINGFALGGGLEVALACDMRLASEDAQLGLPEVGLGVLPGFGGTQRLPRLVGAGRAKELVLTGKRIPAQEALEMGLVNHVHPPGELMDAARELAGEILENGPVAVRLAKEVMTEGMRTDLEGGLELERKAFGLAFSTHDQEEGMRAFLEKRAPRWKGE